MSGTLFLCAIFAHFSMSNTVQSRVGERFTENSLGVRLEQLLDLLFIRFRVRPDALDAELFEGDAEQVDRAAVDGGDGDEAVACGAEVEDGEQGSGLTRGGQHGADAAPRSGDLLSTASQVGLAKRRRCLGRHIKQGRDLCGRVEAIGGGQNDGHDAGAAVFPACSLHAGIFVSICIINYLSYRI